LRLPWTRFYKGLQVNLLIKKPINLKIGLPSHQWAI